MSINELKSKIHLSIHGCINLDGTFDWTAAVIDAAIISGITLFTGLATLAAANSLETNGIVVLVSAVGSEFLGILATKRGLTRPTKKE